MGSEPRCEGEIIGPIYWTDELQQQFPEICTQDKEEMFADVWIDGEQTIDEIRCGMPYNTRLDIVRGMFKRFNFVMATDEPPIENPKQIVMTIKETSTFPDSETIISKEYDEEASDLENGSIVFTFEQKDTRELEEKTYWFDVQLVLDERQRYQLAIGNFIIARNVLHSIA